MSSGDSMTPCSICGYPGHWESACDLYTKPLEQKVADLQSALSASQKALKEREAQYFSNNRALVKAESALDAALKREKEALDRKLPRIPGVIEHPEPTVRTALESLGIGSVVNERIVWAIKTVLSTLPPSAAKEKPPEPCTHPHGYPLEVTKPCGVDSRRVVGYRCGCGAIMPAGGSPIGASEAKETK